MKCEKYSSEDAELIFRIGFITGPICQTIVGIFGVLGNVTSVLIIVKSKKLRNAFYNLVICHVLIQTGFILTAVSIESYFYLLRTRGQIANALFAYILFPLKQIMLHSSTYLIVLMAKQR